MGDPHQLAAMGVCLADDNQQQLFLKQTPQGWAFRRTSAQLPVQWVGSREQVCYFTHSLIFFFREKRQQ